VSLLDSCNVLIDSVLSVGALRVIFKATQKRRECFIASIDAK